MRLVTLKPPRRTLASNRAGSKSPAPPTKRASSRSRAGGTSTQASPAKRRSSRIKSLTHSGAQKAYAVGRQAVDGLTRVHKLSAADGAGDAAEKFEAAGLAIGLFVIGGLGLASAGVFGADEIHQDEGGQE